MKMHIFLFFFCLHCCRVVFRFSFFALLHFFFALWIALGRCLIAVGNARLAESFLQTSMRLFPHPDTILLLGKPIKLKTNLAFSTFSVYWKLVPIVGLISHSLHLRCVMVDLKSCQMTFHCWSSRAAFRNWLETFWLRLKFTSKSFNSTQWTRKPWVALLFIISTIISLKWHSCTTEECFRWDWTLVSFTATLAFVACMVDN